MHPDPQLHDDRQVHDAAVSAQTLPGLLTARLAEHYRPVHERYQVDLCVSDMERGNWRFTLGRDIECTEVMPSALAPTARIIMSSAVAVRMLADPTGFDPRSNEIAAQGGVRIEGAARVAAYWLQLLKRPLAADRAALERAQARVVGPIDEVENVHARTTPHWLRRLLQCGTAGLPLRVRGAFEWPEVGWTLAQWHEHEGHVALRRDPASGRVQTVSDFLSTLASAGLASGADLTYSGGGWLPAAWNGRFDPAPLPPEMFGPAQLWFGRSAGNGLVTQLHCDIGHSFLAQVHGRKRVRLYAPQEASNVYALDAFNTYRPCLVDAGAPDLTHFPKFADARFDEVTIEPGDLLLIPLGWFHCVWASDSTLSISRFASDSALHAFAHLLSAAAT
jgi:Cupin-like domain